MNVALKLMTTLTLMTLPLQNAFSIDTDHFHSLTSKKKSYVTGTLLGQFGNQIFIVAATVAYAWDYHMIPVFPDFDTVSDAANLFKYAFNRDQFFFRLNTSQPPRPFINSYQEPFSFCTDNIPVKKDIRLTGFFQAINLFHHHREKLLSLFAPSFAVDQYLSLKYGDLISLSNTVSVHVRTYNESCHENGHCFLGLDYYRQAMDYFPEDTVFVIFSDRINWCKVHFSKFGKNMVFIDGNDHVQDLFLMSKMKNHIISNSSYAWWGAYLDPKEDAKIIAPTFWLHPSKLILKPNLFLPNWICITPNLDEPYPSDIRDYDEVSLSVDTQ